MALTLALLLLTAAQGEDAAHRADRTATQALNRRAAAAIARRDTGNADAAAGYRAARARYEREMAAWRARVTACENGDRSACDF